MPDLKPVFTTLRLIVRRWHPEDLTPLVQVYGDAEAMRYVGNGQPIAEAACKQWITTTLDNYRKRGYGMYALVEAGTKTVIGFAGLVHPGGRPEPEVKYALLRSYRGQGFATEAVSGLLRYARDELGLARIIATTHPENTPSHRVLTKVGMTRGERVVEKDESETLIFRWQG